MLRLCWKLDYFLPLSVDASGGIFFICLSQGLSSFCLCFFYSWTVSEAADPIPLNLWSICVYYVCVCMEIYCWEICLQVSLWVSLNCLQLKVLLSTKTAGGGGGGYSLTVLCLLFCKYVYHCWKPAWKKISWCCAISRGLEWGGEIKSTRVPLLCSWIILSIRLSCKHHCYCRHSWNCCAAYVEICSNLMSYENFVQAC